MEEWLSILLVTIIIGAGAVYLIFKCWEQGGDRQTSEEEQTENNVDEV